MYYRLFCAFLITSGTLVAFPEWSVDKLGLRFGIGQEKGEDMVGVEAMAYLDSDCCNWNWELGDAFEFTIAPESSLGFINGQGELAAMAHLGFAGLLDIDGFPLTLVISSGPTILTRHKFGSFDMGSLLQFTSAIGVNFQPINNWTLGYRFQHMSNAGIDKINPGLDMHAFTVAYSF